ncbi:amino acid polyamine transporter I protein [Rutstroemia sp. NJR-2017a BVV2]|nr:amino acid polyamine transporter I protein [Rutstroemia sp. NJR-2017a BVV2]PQE18355.1 amino acid polyamine transporter I protein [Rutstroemia sp. NJR-2017a BVV2]
MASDSVTYEMNTMDSKGLRNRAGHRDIEGRQIEDEDTLALARSGKKQILKFSDPYQRRFGFISVIGFACTLMNTWEGVLTGGPAGLLYGFFVAWVGTSCVFMSLGELNSMSPTAGGQYHYVYVLAPPSTRRFLSYVTGWMTVAGWTASTATASFFSSSLIQGLLVLWNPSYSLVGWQGTLLYWAVIALTLSVNTVFSKILPAIESTVLVLHILGFFAVLIPLVRLAPHSDSHEIWTHFINSGWSTMGLAFFVGLEGVAAPFVGTDGAIHMSEEIKGAARTVPRAMLSSIIINGILGFGMLLAILYCQGDISAAAESPTGYPFIAIFASGVQSIAGATVMVSIVIFMAWCNAIGCLASASRMMWSFARDKGLPFSSTLSKVQDRSLLPMAAILAVTVSAALLGLINIGSTTVFNDVISLALEGLFSSYFVALCLLLWRRVRGDIAEENDSPEVIQEESLHSEKQLRWGPWRVKGLLGVITNFVGCVYLFIMIFFCFWPAILPVTPANMNYSSLIWGFVLIFSILYYIFWARKIYEGPVVEVGVFAA